MARSHSRSQGTILMVLLARLTSRTYWLNIQPLLPLELLITVNMFINLTTSPSRVIGKVKNGKRDTIVAGIEYSTPQCERLNISSVSLFFFFFSFFFLRRMRSEWQRKEDMQKDRLGLCVSPQPPESLGAFEPPPWWITMSHKNGCFK